jgi:hypothetical protein
MNDTFADIHNPILDLLMNHAHYNNTNTLPHRTTQPFCGTSRDPILLTHQERKTSQSTVKPRAGTTEVKQLDDRGSQNTRKGKK